MGMEMERWGIRDTESPRLAPQEALQESQERFFWEVGTWKYTEPIHKGEEMEKGL